jgi:predicted metalloendopeptidase
LRDLNLGRLKEILEELEASNGSGQSIEHTKLADFYNSYMDEKKIQDSNKDLNELIELCSKAAEVIHFLSLLKFFVLMPF